MPSVSRVFVHIGPLKTGTTFLQSVLFRNRDALLANGVILPRETFGMHVRSVLGLLGRKMHAGGNDADSRQWQVLVDEITAADASTAVISMEFLCTASAKNVQTLVETLAPAEVHIVFTARDLVKVIPAAWQTLLRNKQAPQWQTWLESVRQVAQEGSSASSSPSAAARRLLGRRLDPVADTWGSRLWRQQDPRQVLEPYLQHIPAERIHIVTVPPSGAPPGLLWERFCDATAMDPTPYDLDVPRSNTSLGGVESEVMRRVNVEVAGRIPGDVYSDLIKHFLAREVLEQRTQSFPLVLPDDDRGWVVERSRDAVDYFGSAGFRLHGDLADLVAPPTTGPGRRPDDVSDAELVAVLEQTLAAVLLEMTRRQDLLPYPGPRSLDDPLPAPHELGLTGEPPGPRTRLDVRMRRAVGGEPPLVTARKQAKKKAARQRARSAEQPGAQQNRPATGADETVARRAAKKAAKRAARQAAKKAAKKAAPPPP